ncbi:unnamed protein product, partial [Allacma fusca]
DWMQTNLRKSGGVYDRLVRCFYVSATPLDRKLLWTMYTNNRDGIRTAYLRCIHEITGLLPSPVAHSTPKPIKPKDERCGYCLGHAEGGWVQCGHCPTWYHDFCVRVDLAHVANTEWLCPKCSDVSVVSLPSRVLHSVSVRRMEVDEISAIVERDLSGKMYKTPTVLTSLIPVEAIQVDPAQVPSPPGSDVENVEMESDKDDCVSSSSLDDFQVHSMTRVNTSKATSRCVNAGMKTTARPRALPEDYSQEDNSLPVTLPHSFELLVAYTDWMQVVETNHGVVRTIPGWTDLVYDYFEKTNPYCVLVFCRIVAYASLISFRRLISARGQFFHHKDDMFKRKLQNFKRRKVALMVTHRKAGDVAAELHADTKMDAVYAGNLTTRPSKNVIRVVRTQELARGDYHEDPIMDIILQKREETRSGTPFIRMLMADPFQVVYYSEHQIVLLKLLLDRRGPLIGHIDATGSIVREISDLEGSTKTFMYAITVAHPHTNCAPIALCEFLSNSHGATDIQMCLQWFNNKALGQFQRRHSHVFRRIETDFSFALISAVLDTFSHPKMTLKTYLNHCFQELCGASAPCPVNFHVCRSHMMRTLMEQVKKRYTNYYRVKPELKHLLQSYLTSKSLADVAFYIGKVFLLICTPTKSSTLYDCVDAVHDQPKFSELEKFDMQSVSITDEWQRAKKYASLYASTGFGISFKRIHADTVAEIVADNNPNNDFLNASFCNYLLKDVLPFTPLVTHCMAQTRKDDYEDDQQWPAEFWNRVIKFEHLKNVGKQKAGRYIRKSKQVLKGLCNDFEASLREKDAAEKRILKFHQVVTPKRATIAPNRKLSIHPSRTRCGSTMNRGTDASKSFRFPDIDEMKECWSKKGVPVARRTNTYTVFDRLKFVLWAHHATDNVGTTFTNTCPLDNGLMIINFLLECYTDIREFFHRRDGPGQHVRANILRVIDYVREDKFNTAKKHWLLYVLNCKTFKDLLTSSSHVVYDMLGCEDRYVLTPLRQILEVFEVLHNCPTHGETRTPTSLQYEVYSVQGFLNLANGGNGGTGINGSGTGYRKCPMLKCNNKEGSWRITFQGMYKPVPFFAIGVMPPRNLMSVGQQLRDVPSVVELSDSQYKLVAATVYRCDNHFVTLFPHSGDVPWLSDDDYPPFNDNSQTACKIRAEAVINFFNGSTYSYKAANIMANALRYIPGKGLGVSGKANECIVTPPPDIEALGFRRLDSDIMKSVGKTYLRDDTPIDFGRKYDRFVSGGFVPGANDRDWRELKKVQRKQDRSDGKLKRGRCAKSKRQRYQRTGYAPPPENVEL